MVMVSVLGLQMMRCSKCSVIWLNTDLLWFGGTFSLMWYAVFNTWLSEASRTPSTWLDDQIPYLYLFIATVSEIKNVTRWFLTGAHLFHLNVVAWVLIFNTTLTAIRKQLLIGLLRGRLTSCFVPWCSFHCYIRPLFLCSSFSLSLYGCFLLLLFYFPVLVLLLPVLHSIWL